MSQKTENHSTTQSQIFDFHSEYKGYCRVYVKSCGALYCFQEDAPGKSPSMYVCTDEGEPSYLVIIPTNSELNLQGCNYLKDEITEAFNRGDYF